MRAGNVFNLGVKEFFSLLRDPVLLLFVVYSFTLSVYSSARASPETLNNAPIAIVDEDGSPLSKRIAEAFYAPYFQPPAMIDRSQMDARMDAGRDTFALDIPPDFQRDVLAGRSPAVQLNVDATRMSQAFTGSGYVETILLGEVDAFVQRYRALSLPPVDLALRAKFNPQLDRSWFGAIIQVINNVTLLSIVLTGAALIREREHGTIEHLLVMPVTPAEIMLGKVWSMGLVVLVACAFALLVMVRWLLGVDIQGSIPLFLAGACLHLFATTSMGIFLATVARSMPQFGLLVILVLIPMNMLSGGMTPLESMPAVIRNLMMVAPTTHFILLAQLILYRDAGLEVVWPQFLALLAIGSVLFALALYRFRKSLNEVS